MRSLPWLLLTFAAVLGGIWLSTRKGGASLVVPATAVPEPPGPDLFVDADAQPAPGTPATVAPVVVGAREQLAKLRRDLEGSFGLPAEELDVLGRVLELGRRTGYEPAYELLVQTLTHPESSLRPKPAEDDPSDGPSDGPAALLSPVGFSLLSRVRGSLAVGGFAAQAIEAARTDRSDPDRAGVDRTVVQSYQRLLATNGRWEDYLVLLEQLHSFDPALSKGAAESLVLEPPTDRALAAALADAIFEILVSPRECRERSVLAKALLAIDPHGARPRLRAVAFEGADLDRLASGRTAAGPGGDPPRLAADVRKIALQALSNGFDAETRDRSIEFYLDRGAEPDPDAELRDEVPTMWRLLPALEADAGPEEIEARRQLLSPLHALFLDALASGESWRIEHVRRVTQAPAFQPLDPAIQAGLAAAAGGAQRD